MLHDNNTVQMSLPICVMVILYLAYMHVKVTQTVNEYSVVAKVENVTKEHVISPRLVVCHLVITRVKMTDKKRLPTTQQRNLACYHFLYQIFSHVKF